jgi:hypothetical protein
MHISARVVLLGIVFGLSWSGISRAEDATCQGIYASQCWASLSGPNYCQVAVGHTPGGTAGIACAVRLSQLDTWGGVLHCFAAQGTSSAVINGRGGEEAQNPGPFSSTDSSKRMISLAIKPETTSGVPGVRIFILRSDGHLFQAVTRWPLPEGGDPRIFFSDTGASVLSGIREIAWVPASGVVATTTDNLRYVQNGTGWNQMTGATAFTLGGNNDTTGQAFYATSTRLNTTAINNFAANVRVDTLPGLLAPGPDQNFGPFGRTRPLSVGGAPGAEVAYAVIKTGTSNLCAGLPPLRPCILQAFKGELFPVHWGPWTLLPTRDISANAPYAMPWTIQDGFWMRGVQGEVWVITGAQHLKFWVP